MVIYGSGHILNFMRHREKYKNYLRERAKSGVRARLANIMARPAPDYPEERRPGKITISLNGQDIVVDLIPEGNCTQYLAIFNGEKWRVAGMKAIHAEIRKRMPPLKGW